MMDCLVHAGVRHVFQVTGRGSLFLSDALAKNSDLTAVSLHHEQACAFAALGYAEKSRGLGACLVSTGCAATNTMTGVLSAWQDGVPSIFISGQNILRETTRHTGIALRTYGQQETDIVALVRPITKYSHMLSRAQDIGEVMERALSAALNGRKGPVWVDVPLDLQSALIDPESLTRATITCTSREPTIADVESIARDLRRAQRPVVLIGKGVRSAGAEILLKNLIELWNIPLTYAASAPDTYGTGHALSIGSVGAMGCSRAGNFALQNSDYVLVLGSRLTALTTGNDYCKFARAARIAVVDIDAVEHSKDGVRIDHLVCADLKLFLKALLQQSAQPVAQHWVDTCQHWKEIFGKVEPTFLSPDVIDLYQLADRLSHSLPAEATLVTDSGSIEVILPTNVRFLSGMDCIHPASQGAMGFALPAAIGAQYATDKSVVAIIGDGSIMMNLQELQSLRYHNLPIKIVVINNNVYSIIRRRQRELFRKRTIGTDPENGVSCPDFAKVAACFGLHYQRIESINELDAGLAAMFAHEGSVLCEIVGREDQSYIELGRTRSTVNGRFVRRPLEDQAPFISREIFLKEMIIEPIDQ